MEREHTFVDKILSWIPGYAGYADRDQRRQTDSRLRDRVSAALQRCERLMEKKLIVELKNNRGDTVEAIEECRKRLNTFAARTKYAPAGVSGFMNQKQLKENELQIILEKDLDLMETVSQLTEKIEGLAIPDIHTVLNRLTLAFDERNEFIKEFK